jgi:hypothetical protein
MTTINAAMKKLGLPWPSGDEPKDAKLNAAGKLAVTASLSAQLGSIGTMVETANIACDPEAALNDAVAKLRNIGNEILDLSSSLGVDPEKDVLPALATGYREFTGGTVDVANAVAKSMSCFFDGCATKYPSLGAKHWKKSVQDVGSSYKATWLTGRNNSVWSDVSGTFKKMDGAMTRIDAHPNGGAWGIDTRHRIWYHGPKDKKWTQKTGSPLEFKDIGVGHGGDVWAVGKDGYTYQYNGKKFIKKSNKTAWRVDVGPKGAVWIVHSSDSLSVSRNPDDAKPKWSKLPGTAQDISIDERGRAWKIDGNSTTQEWKYDTYWLGYAGKGGINITAGRNQVISTSTNKDSYKSDLPKFEADPGPETWRFSLQSVHTSKCLVSQDDINSANHQAVQQKDCQPAFNHAEQEFLFRNVSSTLVKFTNAGNGLCLGIDSASLYKGGFLASLVCAKAANQSWNRIHKGKDKHGNDQFQLQAQHTKMCLSTPVKGTLHQVTCNSGSADQLYRVYAAFKAPSTYKGPPKVDAYEKWKYYFKVARSQWLCFDIKGANKRDPGTWDCNQKDNQALSLRKNSGKLEGSVRILNHAGQCLNVLDHKGSNASTAQTLNFSKCSANAVRMAWKLTNVVQGGMPAIQLYNAHAKKCVTVDVPKKGIGKGNKIYAKSCGTGNGQTFLFDRVSVM